MRQLSDAMKVVNGSVFRAYLYRVYIWDALSQNAPNMQAIVRGTADLSYRMDVTDFVDNGLRISDPGDRRASRLTMSLVADDDRFNPHGGSQSRFIREGCIVRVLEGDQQVDEDEWVYTFTGHIRGQSGFSIDRDAKQRKAEISAYSRLANPKFSKMPFISPSYPRFTDYGQIVLDIAYNVMGLRTEEIARIDTSLGKVTQFASSSIVDLTPLEAIDKILETIGFYADFDGEGVMRYVDRDMTRAPDKIESELCFIQAFRIPASDVNVFNAVSVVGLNKNIEETEHPGEELASAQVVAGFWRPRETVRVQWSKDRSARAKNTQLEIIQSIQDTLLFSGFGTEVYEELDDYSGRIVVDITGYLATMLLLFGVVLLLQAAIGDLVVSFFGGLTIPVGKIVEAITLKILIATLTVQSTGQYTVVGTLLIPVFREISVQIGQSGVPDYLVNQKEIRNDWLNDQDELLEVAQRELIFEFTQGQPREVEIINDLALEIGDIIYLPFGGGLRLWVESISKSISREELPSLRVSAYRAL